jgi:hypothetical protein
MPTARRPGMGAGLDGTPVVAGGHHHGIDAVHDALVVGGGTIRIDGSEGIGIQDAVDDAAAGEFLGRQRVFRQADAGARQAAVG